ncbi:hypothetical protein ACH8ZP_02295 [Chlamydia pneumoniae]|nr:hypothetical protein [Chlamydia pneumoniae]CRI32974.1 hypothetical protein BN1224_Wien1_A_04810 [Chlamydia pneumoniae]CRI35837.1 hypothetical protein BN1224_CM1_A_04840 [Chlamydia pneumoniae]CRI38089.1 hypothetical protein BN1224_CV15_B_04120 [Chlamydia pneumoniae]CRI39222.1 hypothetical protein BN1224_CWL011_A_04860 [Chlamydia pneumoniae]CRI40354.1 hypothetical protein CWL029c_C_03140 [Chlamydia pneumoniae]
MSTSLPDGPLFLSLTDPRCFGRVPRASPRDIRRLSDPKHHKLPKGKRP